MNASSGIRSTGKRIRIIIFDERKILREGLKCLLEKESDLEIVGSIGRQEDVLTHLRTSKPEILIMPGRHFFLALEALSIKDIRRDTQIIIETIPNNIFCSLMLARGINGIVLATSGRMELLSAIRCVALKKRYVDPALSFEDQTEIIKLKQLSARELDILYLIAQGYENLEIAKIMYITERTVRNHTSHLLRKLELQDRTQVAVYAWENSFAKLAPDVLRLMLKKFRSLKSKEEIRKEGQHEQG
ncbi:MAG: response regulator transcription factor [Synergistaceae bacterium]|nr:response regulator transcription factor [Synergistaceae bacterium]